MTEFIEEGVKEIPEVVVHRGVLGARYTMCGEKKLVGGTIIWSNNWTFPLVNCPECLVFRDKPVSYIPEKVKQLIEEETKRSE